jgi:formate/nitrite transporter FocA (FNT family)
MIGHRRGILVAELKPGEVFTQSPAGRLPPVSGRNPSEIWDRSVEEGERRMGRSVMGLLATGLVGGIDIMLGILALAVTTGALVLVMPAETAHLIGSLGFGIGLVFLLIGRSELFTENFMVPVSATIYGRGSTKQLLRLWGGTLVGNLLGLTLLALIMSRAGLVPPSTLQAAGDLADTFAARDAGAALLSGIVAGTVMTLLTWLAHAASGDSARIAIALLVGFVLAAPSLNHAVVSFGEMAFGVMAGTGSAGWLDIAQNFPLAVAGNLIGGLGFVTLARIVQVRGDPEPK